MKIFLITIGFLLVSIIVFCVTVFGICTSPFFFVYFVISLFVKKEVKEQNKRGSFIAGFVDMLSEVDNMRSKVKATMN